VNPRVVFDTNVLISGILTKNTPPAQAIDFVLENGQYLISPDLAYELSSVIRRDRFNAYITLEARESFLTRFVEHSNLVVPKTSVTDCRDPKDNHLLSLALDGKAQYLVTGDDDLLVLNPFHGVSILNPAAFLEQVLP
jgi:putative PIN family toxin of toxin-antitoxin system